MTTAQTNALLDAALAYAARGWAVIPLHDVTTGVCSCAKGVACGKDSGKHPRLEDWGTAGSTAPAVLTTWWTQWPDAHLGILTGHRSRLAVLDIDPRNGGDVALEDFLHHHGPLPETPLVLSGGGGQHYYFACEEDLPGYKLAPGLDLQLTGQQVVAPPSGHRSGRCYAWEASSHPDDVPLAPLPAWILAHARAKQTAQAAGVDLPDTLPTVALTALPISARIKYLIRTGEDPDTPTRYPSRSEAGFAVISALLQAKVDVGTIAAVLLDPQYPISAYIWERKNPKSPFYVQQTRQWIAKDIARAQAKARAPVADRTIPDMTQDRHQQHAGTTGVFTSYVPREKGEGVSPSETRSNVFPSLNSLTSYPWPTLGKEAFYGLGGDFVRAITPHSESDPAALLAQFLTVAGVVMGRHRYYQVEATRHYPNLFLTLAGLTSRARKGTSYAHIDAPMRSADPTWTLDNHIKGCGSGEGLIFAVRDARTSREAIKEKGKVKGYEEVEIDAGVSDKRALFQTGEFSSILKVCARDGNTLSEVIRDSWDTGYLRNATKTNPLKATEAHIGIIGHVTIEEIRRLLTSTDAANGFAKRFIWICAKRSQSLPDGGALNTVDFQPFVTRLRDAIAFAKTPGRMERDAEAKAAWHAVYDMLAEDRTGLANTILARAEAQVLRLSMLYALLDQSATITHAHLNAALALWHYAEESAAFIFGESTGDETADTILTALQKTGPEGCTKNTLLEHVFQRNARAGEVERALHVLEQQGRIMSTKRPPAGGKGRPASVYTLQSNEVNEFNEGKPNRYLIASNDAVKLMGFSANDHGENNEVNPPTDSSHAPDSSDSSDTPALKSMTCEDEGVRGSVTSETPTVSAVSEDGVVVAPPDCLPPPCTHPETTTKRMEDGSTLVRCKACRRIVRVTVSPERRE